MWEANTDPEPSSGRWKLLEKMMSCKILRNSEASPIRCETQASEEGALSFRWCLSKMGLVELALGRPGEEAGECGQPPPPGRRPVSRPQQQQQ